MVYWTICEQQIYQKSFIKCLCQYIPFSINSFCQYLSFISIFFDRFYPVEKCGGTPYRDALTLSKGNPQSDFEFDVLTRYKRQTISNWHN